MVLVNSESWSLEEGKIISALDIFLPAMPQNKRKSDISEKKRGHIEHDPSDLGEKEKILRTMTSMSVDFREGQRVYIRMGQERGVCDERKYSCWFICPAT